MLVHKNKTGLSFSPSQHEWISSLLQDVL